MRRGLFLSAAAVVLLTGAAPLGAAPKPAVRFAFTGDIAMVAGPVQLYFGSGLLISPATSCSATSRAR